MAELTETVVMDASPATIFLPHRPGQHVRMDGHSANSIPGSVRSTGAGRRAKASGRRRFVEVVPYRRWCSPSGWDEPDMRFPLAPPRWKITLIPDGDKTRVRLVHRSLPDDAVGDHTQGLDHYLDRLAVVATGGVVGGRHRQ